MTTRQFNKTRFIRFAAWALAMCVADIVALQYGLRWAMMVPAIFMALFVPTVLLPLNKKTQS
jgi:hypothetical protein